MKQLIIPLLFALMLPTAALAQPTGETIDKIVAIVGEKIIMLSDVETQYWQLVMQGEKQTDELRCTILEELLLQ